VFRSPPSKQSPSSIVKSSDSSNFFFFLFCATAFPLLRPPPSTIFPETPLFLRRLRFGFSLPFPITATPVLFLPLIFFFFFLFQPSRRDYFSTKHRLKSRRLFFEDPVFRGPSPSFGLLFGCLFFFYYTPFLCAARYCFSPPPRPYEFPCFFFFQDRMFFFVPCNPILPPYGVQVSSCRKSSLSLMSPYPFSWSFPFLIHPRATS